MTSAVDFDVAPTPSTAAAVDFDVIVVGSGFGGAVAALRLSEKGYRVGLMEAGRRFRDEDLPTSSWKLRDFLWAPALGWYGIQRIHVLRNVAILAGAGVGGGSLVYANTLYEPGESYFADPQWAGITDWHAELRPFYALARRMLGVVDNPTMTPSDEVMRKVADEMGVGHTFHLTPVGVFFGDGPGVPSPDPFFGGAGPSRNGCIECGGCMTGCRHNAKNTLPKNYLALAEAAGAVVFPLTTVDAIVERRAAETPGSVAKSDIPPRIPTRGGASAAGFVVATRRTGRGLRTRRTFTATHVVVAAGTYGSQRLLHRMKEEGYLPRLSGALGRRTRTNSESLIGATTADTSVDYSYGVAITSSFNPDPTTRVEPVRYGRGSDSMGLMSSVLTEPEPGVPRWRTTLRAIAREPRTVLRLADVRGFATGSIIALVMQSVDNSLTVVGRRGRLGRWRLTTRQDESTPAPTSVPAGAEVVRRAARHMNGIAAGNAFENLDIALTAHFIGGCSIGATADEGVIDPYHRAFGHPGLTIVDGSAVTANLGVNPSLTITAQAERAMAMWPNRGDADPRPAPGEPYRPVAAVAPHHPSVPGMLPAP